MKRMTTFGSMFSISLLAACAASLLWCESGRAADDLKETTALKFVPSDVGFYASWLRNREQFEIVAKSNALAKLKTIPSLKQAWSFFESQFAEDNEFSPVKEWLSKPENKELADLSIDALSNEVFFYGDAHWMELTNAINQMNRQTQLSLASPDHDPMPRMVHWMAKHKDTFKATPLVVGARLKEPRKLTGQLSRLQESWASIIPPGDAAWKGRLKREKIAGGDFVTLSLDGTLIPWDEFPTSGLGDAADDFQKIVEHFKKQTLAISVGLRGDYLYFSVGANTEHLAKLGTGPLLADQPGMKPVFRHAQERLTSVSFASGKMMAASVKSNFDQFEDLGRLLTAAAGEVDDTGKLAKELNKDVEQMSKAVSQLMPDLLKSGDQSAVSFLTPRGYEMFTYMAGGNAAKVPAGMSILGQLGGSPLMFLAGHTKWSVEGYDSLRPLAERAVFYLEEFAIPKIEDEEGRAKAKKGLAAVKPAFAQADAAIRKLIIPGLGEGEMALVVDAKIQSKQWNNEMPAADHPLPGPELGLVVTVADPEKLKQGMQELVAAVKDGAKRLHEALPDEIPEIKIPSVEGEKTEGGAVYAFRLPDEAGLDRQYTPAVGLGAKYAAGSISVSQTKRMLTTAPFTMSGPPGKDLNKATAAFYFNWVGLVKVARPWVDYGYAMAEENGGTGELLEKSQMHTVLDVLACLKTMQGVTYSDGELSVSHAELHFEDLP